MRKDRLFLGILFVFSIPFSCSEASRQPGPPVVETTFGKLEGTINHEGSVMAFKGIPYAAAPVGDLRWKEPQPPKPWEGIRDASGFCASCMQNRIFSHLPNGPWTEEFMVQDSVSEDCLFLNIWSPVTDREDPLPILVYIHGGALTEGSGSIDVYDGEELAKKGIVVITINYRLGALGFLSHPELTAESPHGASGNYGFLDQVAALKWIRENIAAFGGDRSRVTIAGQSAGAASVNALIASPLARGLFHGAITQSGTSFTRVMRPAIPLSDAEEEGLEFARIKGASSLADLRAMPAAEIISRDPETAHLRFRGVLDSYFQTDHPEAIFQKEAQNDTPFMSGMNADETRYTGSTGEELMSLYLSEKRDSIKAIKLAGQEQSRLNTCLWMEFRAEHSEKAAYVYFFDRAIPWPEYPRFGAFHTSEVPYVFNNLKKLTHHSTEKADTLIADRISSYWVNFVKKGDPNGPGLPVWEPFDPNQATVMRLGENMEMMPIASSGKHYEFLKDQLIQSLQ